MIKEVTDWKIDERIDYKFHLFRPDEETSRGFYVKIAGVHLGYFIGNEYQKNKLIERSQIEPVEIGYGSGSTGKVITRYWLYKGRLFKEDEGIEPSGLKLLLDERIERRKRRIEKLKSKEISTENEVKLTREPIPEDVKMYVWKRDGGRCVNCGSNKNLEFDHIIPISMGGSNTARNVQLLCEECNRKKGGNLI